MIQKEIIEIELSKKGLQAEKLTKRKGVWIFKKSYFFSPEKSAKGVARKIAEALPKVIIISIIDKWNAWPERSEFVIKFKMEGIK